MANATRPDDSLVFASVTYSTALCCHFFAYDESVEHLEQCLVQPFLVFELGFLFVCVVLESCLEYPRNI